MYNIKYIFDLVLYENKVVLALKAHVYTNNAFPL
jgi:hypothetical protein